MAYHTPKQTKQVLDIINSHTDFKWYDSSYRHDETDSIVYEVSEDKYIKIMLPNSFIQDEDNECYTDFVITDDNHNVLLVTKDLNEIINYINSNNHA